MIRLKKILEDIQTEETAYIIDGDKRAFVGVEHGKTPKLPKTGIEKIKSIGDKWGYWYEGGGGDKDVVKPVFGNIKYKGSWDERIADLPVENPYVFVYTLFSNTKENDTIEKVKRAEGKTVFDKCLASHGEWGHETIRDKSDEEVKPLIEKFFRNLGEDYYNDSQQPATDENIETFIHSVEDDMWDGWPNGSGPAFQMAWEANTDRDRKLVDTIKEGVIFIGVGHIELIWNLK